MRRSETLLLSASLVLGLLACLAPPYAQPAQYHAFADQRGWLGIPHAMDVLSNLAYAVMGLIGLGCLRRLPLAALGAIQHRLATLFFMGLLVTTVASAWYHWQPDDVGLAVDRYAMVLAFAGLLGVAVASHISARAGAATALAVLLLGPFSVSFWFTTGNLSPWGVLQFGVMALMLGMAWRKPLAPALVVCLGVLILIYAIAKVLELTDSQVFELTGHLVSGHSLEHIVSAFAAWPVISAIARLGQNAADKKRRTL